MADTSDEGKREKLCIALALLSVYFIWGSGYLAIRIAIVDFPPFMMSGLRFVTAGSLLYLIVRIKGVRAPTLNEWSGASLVGFVLLGGGNGGIVIAEQWITSGFAALIMAITPFWLVLFSGIRGQWPDRIEWAGLFTGFVGVALLNMEGNLRANPLGTIIGMSASVLWALGADLSRRVSLPPGLMGSAVEMMAGGALMILASLVTGEKIPATLGLRSAAALVYLIAFSSMIGYTSFGYLIKRVRPGLAMSFSYVNPAVAVLLGITLGGEQVALVGFAAMLVILAGVVLVMLGRKVY
jgi:drug/metabolite transporter (DMT)-like permease